MSHHAALIQGKSSVLIQGRSEAPCLDMGRESPRESAPWSETMTQPRGCTDSLFILGSLCSALTAHTWGQKLLPRFMSDNKMRGALQIHDDSLWSVLYCWTASLLWGHLKFEFIPKRGHEEGGLNPEIYPFDICLRPSDWVNYGIAAVMESSKVNRNISLSSLFWIIHRILSHGFIAAIPPENANFCPQPYLHYHYGYTRTCVFCIVLVNHPLKDGVLALFTLNHKNKSVVTATG